MKKIIFSFFSLFIFQINLSAKQWIIIYAEKISPDAPVGHVYATFIQEDIFQQQTKVVGCWGFYPQEKAPKGIWGNIPGEIRDDWKTPRDYSFLVEVSDEEFNHCLRIKDLYKERLDYSLNGQSCVNFVRDIVSAITKLRQPSQSTKFPSEIVIELKFQNKAIEDESIAGFSNSIGNITNTTHADMNEFDFAKEPAYINKYGEGKVRRLSEHQVEVILTNGKKLLLKDLYNAKYKYYESLGYFIGYTDQWNSFIFAGFEGGVKLVSRTTGDISDDIFLSEIEQKNNTAEVSYDGLHFYKVWSPENKFLAIVRNSANEEDAAIELVLYAVQPTFKQRYKNVYIVSTFQNSNVKTQYWEPGELTWLDNTTLQIKKIRRIGGFNNEKFVGNAWLILQGGKWILTSVKPLIKR